MPVGAKARPSHRRLTRDQSRVHASWSLAAALLALAVTALSAVPQDVTAVEERLFDALNHLPDIFEWPLWVVMQLGAVLAVPVLGLSAFVTWRRLRPALDVIVAGTLAWISAKVLKDLLERGRPASFLDDVNLRGSFNAENTDGLGFPSGHAAVAFALATVVYPYLAPRWRVMTMGLATAVALSRLYFGAHFPLDALGGAALGIALGASVHLVMDGVTHHH